jgi:hypothetical protein
MLHLVLDLQLVRIENEIPLALTAYYFDPIHICDVIRICISSGCRLNTRARAGAVI